jgi:DNA-binding CsgD family transcriptional regulator
MGTDVQGTRAVRVREAVSELADQTLEPIELIAEVATRLRRVVPYDGAGWTTTDPETLMPTALLSEGAPDEIALRLLDEELRTPDMNKFVDLAVAERPVATLRVSTQGRLELSPRHRSVHEPLGLGDELRAACRVGDATWGGVCMSRADDAGDFTSEEVRYVEEIAAQLGRGLRRSLARPPSDLDLESIRTPGMLVMDEHWRVESSTGEAQRWLSRLAASDGGFDLPCSVVAVAIQAQVLAECEGRARPARARVRLSTGGWLLVHAAVLHDADGSPTRTGVMFEPAERSQLTPLLLRLYGLSEREREVTELLLNGRSTDEVAARLFLSRHTVRDHVKAIFRKVGVASRPELTAALSQEPPVTAPSGEATP